MDRSGLHSSKGSYYFMLLCSQPESPKARLNEMTFSILVKAVPVLHSDEATQGDFKYTVLKKIKIK